MSEFLAVLPDHIGAVTTALIALASAVALLSKRLREAIKAVGGAIVNVVRKIKDAFRNGGPGGPAAAAVIALVVLSGCATVDAGLGYAEGAVKQGTQQAQRAADVKTRAVIRVPCTIEVGSYYRELSPREQAAIDELCGGGQPTAILRPDAAE